MKYLNDSGQVRDDFTIIKSEGNAETIQHLGSTSDYDAANNVSIDVPSAANENDLLLLFLSRTDDLLPIQLNGWTAGASCFKTDNGQSECHEIPDCLQQDGNYCLQFEGGNGRDLATVVFYKTFQANDPTSFDFTLRGSKPSWAILSAIRGADNNDPIGDVATESNDGSPDSKFPSVIGNAGDLLLLSMAFDDTTNENDFLAPDGMETYQWIAGSDEAGYVYGQTLLQTGETGVKTTGGPGGPNAKDALISLIVKQGSTNEPPEEGVILKRITNGLDDVEQRADGSMYLDSSDIELVNDNGNQIVGLRFTNLTIPENSTIVSATVQFTTDEASTDSTSLQIRGENTDNSSPFNNTAQNVSSRSTTSATVAWQPDIWSTEGEANSAQRTPELKSIFQEIVNRNGWRAGNNISLIISGEGKRTAEAFEGSTGNAPLLRIEYEPSSDSEDTTPPVITLVGAESITLQQGTSFVDPGATATDNLDGDLSNDIIVTGSVNTGVVGEYILAYDVSDAAGNSASTVTRTITIESNGDGDGDGDDSSGGGLSLALFLLALLRRKRQQKAS
ncbi:MAG: DUF5011 domain-containing protein [Gammaproteobacteria bacterium]|nr:DUF5011 domain-containing protein [Gammaproteobacteria bacterium]